MKGNNKYSVLGLMSGTSLDGLDIAHCVFEYQNDKLTWQVLDCETIKYTDNLKSKLDNALTLSALEMQELDVELGVFHAQSCNRFIKKNSIYVDFISTHGHTIFHQPKKGFTLQIGKAEQIAAETKLPTVSNFRSLDVAMGGQGAPLVPFGDAVLFPNYDAYLNLGGIANIHIPKAKLAYDISACNMVLNFLAEKLGLEYDKGGEIAKSGKSIPSLLSELESLNYYNLSIPKSLGKEEIFETIIPILDTKKYTINDLMHTCSIHFAAIIAESFSDCEKVLVTGGGAYNSFLIESISTKTKAKIIIPEAKMVEYKEAIIFGFLGYQRFLNLPNINGNLTGSNKIYAGGTIFRPTEI